MSVTMTTRLTVNRFPEIAAALPEAADQITGKTSHDIAGGASERTTRVQTGAMKNGYVAEQTGAASWIVYNTQSYQIFQELGTVHITASPMLIPAAEAARPGFIAAMEQLEMFL